MFDLEPSGLLRFLISAALPWAAGCLWVLAIAPRVRHWAFSVGAGVLLGYLIVALLLVGSDWLGLGPDYWALVLGVCAMGALGGLAALVRVKSGVGPARFATQHPLSNDASPRWLVLLITAAIVVHLVSLLPDVLLRPVFPWDAWQAYVYKARIWFESGALVALAESRQWMVAPADEYVAVGTDHPPLISLLLLWQALAVGHWDDSLLGLPWLMCGLACCLMLYGLLREHALPVWAGLLAAYVLVSLPMFVTHIALIGYADLWMAAFFLLFAGAMVFWFIRGGVGSLVLMAVAVIAMVTTKDTGNYWLAAMIPAVVAGLVGPRVALVGLGMAVVAAVLLIVTGWDPLAWMTSGRYGFDLQEPMPIVAGLWRHMFVWADWHLLWLLAPAILVLGVGPASRDNGLRALFVLVFLGLGILVFSFLATRAGQYLVIGTLFSRMVLHVVPALILLGALVILHCRAGTRTNLLAMKDKAAGLPGLRLLACMALAALVLWSVFNLYALTGDRHESVQASVAIAPSEGDWQVLEGQGSADSAGLVLSEPGGRGVGVGGIRLPEALPAAEFGTIEVHFGPSDYYPSISLGWSRSRTFSGAQSAPLDLDGEGVARLSTTDMPGWAGEIQYFLVEAWGALEPPVVVQSIILVPRKPSFGEFQGRLFGDWSEFESWSQRSPNWTAVGGGQPVVSPVLAGLTWLLLAALLFVLASRGRNFVFMSRGILALFLIIWVLLDARWQLELFHKAGHAWAQFAGKNWQDKRLSELDEPEFQFMEQVKDLVPQSTPVRLFIFSNERYLRLRARYHAVPLSAREGGDELQRRLARKLQPGDWLAVIMAPKIKQASLATGEVGDEAVDLTLPLDLQESGSRPVLRTIVRTGLESAYYRGEFLVPSAGDARVLRLRARQRTEEGWQLLSERDVEISANGVDPVSLSFPVFADGIIDLSVIGIDADELKSGQVRVTSLSDEELMHVWSGNGGPYLVTRRAAEYMYGEALVIQ